MQLRELFAQDASGSKQRPHCLGQLLLAIDEFVDALFKAVHTHDSNLQTEVA
jgi:hypothetical protein